MVMIKVPFSTTLRLSFLTFSFILWQAVCHVWGVSENTSRSPQTKGTANHCLPLQPIFPVKLWRTHWLRPGQEGRVALFSCSKLKERKKKSLECKISLSAQRQVCLVEDSGTASEPLWHLIFLYFLLAFLNGLGQGSFKWGTVVTSRL